MRDLCARLRPDYISHHLPGVVWVMGGGLGVGLYEPPLGWGAVICVHPHVGVLYLLVWGCVGSVSLGVSGVLSKRSFLRAHARP